jgi:hypothetical protein
MEKGSVVWGEVIVLVEGSLLELFLSSRWTTSIAQTIYNG